MNNKKLMENRLFLNGSPGDDVYGYIIKKLKELYPNLSIKLVEGPVWKNKDFKLLLEITNIKGEIT